MPTYPTYKLGDILSYEQPTNYIVESTEYDDSYPTPVLTAGKSFILGYTNETKGVYDKLPVIIFDDFTTASQFVDFKFKVKSSAMKILSCDEEIADIKYMYYLMQITHIQSDTHKRYWISDYSKISVYLPPLPTQQAIVARIETLFAELDKAVQHLRTAQQQLKTYRQAVLNHWLNNDDGKWETVKLGEVAEKIFDGPFGTHLKSDDYVASGIRVVRLENIKAGFFDDSKQSFVTEEKYETIKRHTVYPSDLIMSTFIAEEVKVCQMPEYIGFAVNKADCIGVRLKPEISVDYIKYYLSLRSVYHELEIQVHGATRPRVNTTQIKNIKISLPPLPEQQRIVQEIESRLSQAEAAEARIAESLQKTEALRQSILKKAFSGELV